MATRKEERGCRDYCFAPDPAVPTRVQVYELWDDGESLAAHFKHENYRKMVELLSAANVKESINRAYLVERASRSTARTASRRRRSSPTDADEPTRHCSQERAALHGGG